MYTQTYRKTNDKTSSSYIIYDNIIYMIYMLIFHIVCSHVEKQSIEKNSRAEKSGKVFVGDIVAMASATFGDDMWSCRGVGLGRVLTTIKSRNNR